MRTKPGIMAAIVLVASVSGCLGDGGANRPPTADAGTDIAAQVGEDVVFDGRGLDRDGSVVSYRWDFDGDGAWDYQGEYGSRYHAFGRPGSYLSRLEVVDDEGAKGEDARWVNVTASVEVLVNWTGRPDFVVRVSERLDTTDLAVNWIVHGTGPSPLARTFTRDAGLVRLNATAFNITVPLARIAAGQRHELVVRLGELVVATRTIEVVDEPEAAAPYVMDYHQEVSDYRTLWGWNYTNHFRNGTLVVERTDASMRGHFQGTGYMVSNTTKAGTVSYESLRLSSVAVETGSGAGWGRAWWRWLGDGYVNQTGANNFSATAQVFDLERAFENGTMTKDDWHRVGLYWGSNNTSGDFDWVRRSEGNQVHLAGDGQLYEVLKVRSERYFEGTDAGRQFRLYNNTTDYDASRDVLENRTIYRMSDERVGRQGTDGNWTWRDASWSGYVDDNLDGDFNPDAVQYDPVEAARFAGPRPRVLAVGDMFTASDRYGVVLVYTAKRADTGNLTGPGGIEGVTGVFAEALYNTTWGHVWHWLWVLQDGPAPGTVFEESVLVEHVAYGGGSYREYRNIVSVR